ncbi:hypothetical protein Taro_027955 [Colocasia esculenta]|uniref:Uncharacterized protein n=1 Tax=Colocasia esculenta TaxID=4460 RepID=A0A843VP05_COLES|nr:hypothetical protein [Colocasia esculenta]
MEMATRRGSLGLPLLPSAPSAAPSSSVRPAGFQSGRGSGGGSMRGPAWRKSTPAARVLSTQAKAYLVVEEVETKNKGNNAEPAALLALVADAATVALGVLKAVEAGRRSWPREAEKILESAIFNCRFFTLIGVAGTLVGSILCFVEGCSLIVEAYLEYFHALWEKLDQGEVMSLLIEALDMFLIGSAMLNFGMGLYVMFVGSRGPKKYCIGRVLPRVALSLHEKASLFSILANISPFLHACGSIYRPSQFILASPC